MNFDWSDLAFGSKKSINSLKAVFLAAPREISPTRFRQLVKTYLPQGNIVLGLAKESYILGFEEQPQFRTLRLKTVQVIIDKVNGSSTTHKISTLSYFQRELNFILQKISFKKAVFINGSWRQMFHTLPQYYTLVNRGTTYQLVSPFTDEAEARDYERATKLPTLPKTGEFTASEMLQLASEVAKHSYDYSFQTGAMLGKKHGTKYQLLASTFNKVVPYQTHAMHFGASREANFSPMNDLNHYDTNHAEVELMIKAQKERLNLHGTTLFINLLPCPSCARMFTQTDITEFVYREDHSDGYGLKMLEAAGKKVTRIVG